VRRATGCVPASTTTSRRASHSRPHDLLRPPHSAALAYLHPVRKRPNLVVLTGVQVGRVLMAGARATGVPTGGDPAPRSACSRARSCCAGAAIGTPHVLQLSGICPKAVLERAGVPVLADMPAVGEHLQDDLAVHLKICPVSGTGTAGSARSRLPATCSPSPRSRNWTRARCYPGPGVVEPDDVMRWVAHADRPEAADAATLAWSNARSPSTPRTKPAVVVRVGMEMPGT
jgi:choline dehydrogenase-like flavoprotein